MGHGRWRCTWGASEGACEGGQVEAHVKGGRWSTQSGQRDALNTMHDTGGNGVGWDRVWCQALPWDAVGCRGMPWDAVGCHGMPWDAMGCHGMPWDAVGFRGLWGCLMPFV